MCVPLRIPHNARGMGKRAYVHVDNLHLVSPCVLFVSVEENATRRGTSPLRYTVNTLAELASCKRTVSKIGVCRIR